MANEVILTKVCQACSGSGIDRHVISDELGGEIIVEQECVNCVGTGKEVIGTISGDFFDDIMDKCNDIKEKVDEL